MNNKIVHLNSDEQQRNPTTILDEYCRYYSEFSKILSIYVKNVYPQCQFELEQLLDASYNVWHRLSDEEKISLATFLEELGRESTQTNVPSTLKMQTFNDFINSEFKYPIPSTTKNQKSIALNTSSLNRKSLSKITPFHIYLKDERRKFTKSHSKMSIREMNRCLSERWQKMSHRRRYPYEHRSYLAKKRWYKKQGKEIQLKKPSFIKRISSKTIQKKNKYQQLTNSSRSNLAIR